MDYTESELNFLKEMHARRNPERYQSDENGNIVLRKTSLSSLMDPDNTSRLREDLLERDPNTLDTFSNAAFRGYAKLLAGGASLPAAGLELLGVIDEGSVRKMGMAFETFLNENAPQQEGIMPMMVEAIAQYTVPGIGYYKLFGALTRMKGFDRFLDAALKGEKSKKIARVATKLFGSEFLTTMTAQNPTDPNFASFLVDVFGVSEEASGILENEIVSAIANQAEDWDAMGVFKEKLQAIPGDLLIAGAFEGVLTGIVRTFRAIKKNKDTVDNIAMDELGDNVPDLPESFAVPDNPFITKTSKPFTLATPMEDLIEGAKIAEDARTWYTRHNEVINDLFGDESQLFKELIGITSQQASVDENINRALMAFEYLKTHGTFKDLKALDKNVTNPTEHHLPLLSGVIGNLRKLEGVDPSATGKLASEQGIRERMGYAPTKTSFGIETYLGGNKVPDFVEAMFEGTNEVVTMDRHMIQILFGQKAQVNNSSMAEGKRIVTEIANELGWTPKETQAAIWSFNQIKDSDIVKRRKVDLSDVRDYKKAIEERRDAINELLTRFR
jgi:hypothetical protein